MLIQSVEILNAIGAKVISNRISENSTLHIIDVSELASGTYFLKLLFSNGELRMEKLSIK